MVRPFPFLHGIQGLDVASIAVDGRFAATQHAPCATTVSAGQMSVNMMQSPNGVVPIKGQGPDSVAVRKGPLRIARQTQFHLPNESALRRKTFARSPKVTTTRLVIQTLNRLNATVPKFTQQVEALRRYSITHNTTYSHSIQASHPYSRQAMNNFNSDHPKFPRPASLNTEQRTWWDDFLRSYTLRDIGEELHYL